MVDRQGPKARWARLAALPIVAALLVSCASRRQPPQATPEPPAAVAETPPPAPPLPDPQPTYDRLSRARADYERGIDLIAAGDEVAGEELVVSASAQLRQAAEECAALPGCDLAPFFDAFDHLLDTQSIALKRNAFQVEELEAAIAEHTEREPGTTSFAASLPELDKSISLLGEIDLRELISLNGPVNAAIDDWLTWLRPNLLNAYRNYLFLRPEMAPVYEEAGLPEALLFAMVATESGGKVHAFSRAGAAGPLQFMRRTGQIYGLGVVDDFDMRLDPASSTRANVAYLNEQLALLENSLEKALAAYNGGENRMRRLHERYSDAPFWDSRIYYAVPRETREYVPRVLAAAWLFLHPDDYNLQFPTIDTATTLLRIREPIALGELSVCLGQEGSADGWFRTLRNLNPRLEPGDRIEADEEIRVPVEIVAIYEERCLSGEILERARVIHDANYPDEPEMIVYTVRRGDTLGRIASRFRCASVGQIAAINGIRAPRYVIRESQQLKIPPCE